MENIKEILECAQGKVLSDKVIEHYKKEIEAQKTESIHKRLITITEKLCKEYGDEDFSVTIDERSLYKKSKYEKFIIDHETKEEHQGEIYKSTSLCWDKNEFLEKVGYDEDELKKNHQSYFMVKERFSDKDDNHIKFHYFDLLEIPLEDKRKFMKHFYKLLVHILGI